MIIRMLILLLLTKCSGDGGGRFYALPGKVAADASLALKWGWTKTFWACQFKILNDFLKFH